MLLGNYQTLNARRPSEFGFWLGDESSEILLPNKEVPDSLHVGSDLAVFVYRDSEDRLTATLRRPFLKLGEHARLSVVDVSGVGAWLDWGLDKHLLLPKSEQPVPFRIGDEVVVRLVLDDSTDRLYATAKIGPWLSRDLGEAYLGQEVSLLVWKPHPRGWVAIVENRWQGMIFLEDSAGLLPGNRLKAFVANLREDGKIDLSLAPQGFEAANSFAVIRLQEALAAAGGRLDLHDGSSPEEIRAKLGISKKAFKRACGTLYREKKISLESNAIILRR